ncbi:hypothetical protein GQ600_21373 [Phytophthora cactorum]|nr:hypothetical protein GQ600_21373 [Phytophthora cactorum]
MSDSEPEVHAYFGKSTECKADIKAAVTWNKEERKFMVRVTGSSTSHNHRVDRAVYENHPPVHRVEDPVLLAFVDVMQSSGSKPKRIMQFLREKTGTATVCSAVARMRESAGVVILSSNVWRLFCEDFAGGDETALQCLSMMIPGANVHVADASNAGLFKAFPEVLLVDATHNTNDS